MLSNKWTFSLMSLVVLFALGFAVAPVMAAHTSSTVEDAVDPLAGDSHLIVSFELDTSVIDVSSHTNDDPGIEQDIQIDAGRIRDYASYPRPFVSRGGASPEPVLTFLVEFDKMVPLDALTVITGDDPTTPDTEEVTHTYLRSTNLNGSEGFGLDDISVSAFDEFGRLWGSVTLLDTTEDNPVTDAIDPVDAANQIAKIAFTNPGGTPVLVPGERVGRQFTVEIYINALKNLEKLLTEARGGDFEIATLLFAFAGDSVEEAITLSYQLDLKDPDNYVDGKFAKGLKDDFKRLARGPETAHDIRIDLVDVDEGDPKYIGPDGTAIIAIDDSPTTADPYPDTAADDNPSGFPNVVSITRLRGTSDDIDVPLGFNVLPTSPSNADVFMVKVVLTEQPDASFLGNNGADLISVENGVVIGIDAGLPFGNAAEGTGDAVKDAVLPPISEGSYSDDQERTMPLISPNRRVGITGIGSIV